jgi:hypothetical protein
MANESQYHKKHFSSGWSSVPSLVERGLLLLASKTNVASPKGSVNTSVT